MKKMLILISILLFSCARSEKYNADNNLNDQPLSYLNTPGDNQTPSQRVEQLGQPKKRIVVFDFWNSTPAAYPGIERFAADELRRNLHLSERVIVPTDIQSHLETKDFIEGERVRVSQLIREGRRLGVSVMVIGKIAKIVFRQKGDDVGVLRQVQSLAAADIELKLFDVSTGREVAALGRSGEFSSNSMVATEDDNLQSRQFRAEMAKLALRDATTQLVPDILKSMEKLTWEGRVAKIIGSKIYVNAGRKSGLVAGDILRVLTPGNDIYDPENGAFLGRTDGELKGTVEVFDFVGFDAAVTKPHTGGQFQKGDVLRLY